MKIVKVIAWILLIALVVIQFIPTERNQGDTVPISDFMVVNKVPSSVKETVRTSCYDCHSNNTAYPWYNKVQPVDWYLEDHIKEGKAELDFNEWDTYSDRRKSIKLRSIIKQIESGEMPLDSYTLIHKDAMLSEDDTKIVIDYMTSLKDILK